MRSRRGGYVVTRRSHHPARLRGHPSSGRRGIHFVRRYKPQDPCFPFFFSCRPWQFGSCSSVLAVQLSSFFASLRLCAFASRLLSIEVWLSFFDEGSDAFGEVTRRRAARERLHLGIELRHERPVVALVDQPLDLAERQRRAERYPAGDGLRLGPSRSAPVTQFTSPSRSAVCASKVSDSSMSSSALRAPTSRGKK